MSSVEKFATVVQQNAENTAQVSSRLSAKAWKFLPMHPEHLEAETIQLACQRALDEERECDAAHGDVVHTAVQSESISGMPDHGGKNDCGDPRSPHVDE